MLLHSSTHLFSHVYSEVLTYFNEVIKHSAMMPSTCIYLAKYELLNEHLSGFRVYQHAYISHNYILTSRRCNFCLHTYNKLVKVMYTSSKWMQTSRIFPCRHSTIFTSYPDFMVTSWPSSSLV